MSNNNDILAVPGLSSDVAGAIVYWRLSGTTDLARLALAWPGAPSLFAMPAPTSPEVALRMAVQEQREKRLLVRPLDGVRGWALVSEFATGDDLSHAIECRVKLHAGTYPAVEPANHPLGASIRTVFARAMEEVDAGATSGWLVKQVYLVNAVALRDTGGIYFVPRNGLPAWRELVAVLKATTAHVVHEIPALRSSEAIDAIIEAVVSEAKAEADAMTESLADGDMGARALRSKASRCQNVLSKVASYENLLGRNLDEIKVRVEALKVELTAAAMAAMDGEQSSFAGVR